MDINTVRVIPDSMNICRFWRVQHLGHTMCAVTSHTVTPEQLNWATTSAHGSASEVLATYIANDHTYGADVGGLTFIEHDVACKVWPELLEVK